MRKQALNDTSGLCQCRRTPQIGVSEPRGMSYLDSIHLVAWLPNIGVLPVHRPQYVVAGMAKRYSKTILASW